MSVPQTDVLNSAEQNGAQNSPPPKTKPLRFVTNYGAPHPKRRRIGAACLTCRRRKTACSGERPTCETCSQNKLECAGYSAEAPPLASKRSTSDFSARRNSDVNESNERPKKQIKQEYEFDSVLRVNGHGTQQQPTTWQTPSAHDGHVGLVRTTSETVPEEAVHDSLFSGPRNRMPYFRWLGPTAIMPGFKQMVVKIKRQDTDLGRASTEGGPTTGMSPSLNNLNPNTADQRGGASAAENDIRSPLNLPFYDNSPVPPSELITHLATTFFDHLGCNYPFLQRERFLRDLEEKQVDAILVDAVCALAARFSTHSLLTQQTTDEHKTTPAEYGHAFGQRAKMALVDTFPCPTPAAVQAALLLAYLEFGENRDSGLWMYLGISIRMAQDLGMHKLEGLKYQGRNGPTPKMIKRESMSGSPQLHTKTASSKKEKDEAVAKEKSASQNQYLAVVDKDKDEDEQKEIDERKAVEQERVDTLWAVFFLDRVVSSGTGRRSTLRDKEIELSFPALDEKDPKSGWPAPFPALIRIVHLYGRVADLLNSIKEPSDITSETPKRLASMESQVTNFYQGLSPRLHFDAVNFQHYMKAGEGTNFVLLHFWFHTLIVLLHQPTILKTFEGRMLQLFPNSQQLSMSSAKTIADILSYSQLMDAKASLGNPFTTQPIYIAACAFLKETVEQTATSTAHSRATSPFRRLEKKDDAIIEEAGQPTEHPGETPAIDKRLSISELSVQSNTTNTSPTTDSSKPQNTTSPEQPKTSDKSELSSLSATKAANALAKHSLLATAASQHYQLCYKALESIQTYWAGTTYILTVLNQKFEGVGDPLLYTAEEGESAMERPRPEPAFTIPGWRRKLSWGPYMNMGSVGAPIGRGEFWRETVARGSPGVDPSKAIGWTLTGTMNSPSTNLAWHYPGGANENQPEQQSRQQQQHLLPTMNTSRRFSDLVAAAENVPMAPYMQYNSQQQQQQHFRSASSSSQRPPMPSYSSNGGTADRTSDFLGLNQSSPFQAAANANSAGSPGTHHAFGGAMHSAANGMPRNGANHGHNGFSNSAVNGGHGVPFSSSWDYDSLWNAAHHGGGSGIQPLFGGDMMIESQDVDMSILGLDMMPWFGNYQTQDMSGLFDHHQPCSGSHGHDASSGGAQGPNG